MKENHKYFDSLPYWSINQPSYYYAGIGSRQAPVHILHEMTKIATVLESLGFKLRSGRAKGSDEAFENGVKDDNNKEIFPGSAQASSVAYEIAREIHPSPKSLDNKQNAAYIWNLMARNTHQIFGFNLSVPVDFVLCWTQDGIEHYSQRTQATGGTGQAIELASRKHIPVINMYHTDWRDKLGKLLDEYEQNKIYMIRGLKNSLW